MRGQKKDEIDIDGHRRPKGSQASWRCTGRVQPRANSPWRSGGARRDSAQGQSPRKAQAIRHRHSVAIERWPAVADVADAVTLAARHFPTKRRMPGQFAAAAGPCRTDSRPSEHEQISRGSPSCENRLPERVPKIDRPFGPRQPRHFRHQEP